MSQEALLIFEQVREEVLSDPYLVGTSVNPSWRSTDLSQTPVESGTSEAQVPKDGREGGPLAGKCLLALGLKGPSRGEDSTWERMHLSSFCCNL